MRNQDDLKRELEKIGIAYAESFNKQDGTDIAALYANGGMHINPAEPRTDIEQFYQGIFRAGFMHQEASLDQAWCLDTHTAIAIGQYRIAGNDQSGALMERGGFWTTTYVREAGKGNVRYFV
jgi:hypothetical protein